jgi:hypothetical protein
MVSAALERLRKSSGNGVEMSTRSQIVISSARSSKRAAKRSGAQNTRIMVQSAPPKKKKKSSRASARSTTSSSSNGNHLQRYLAGVANPFLNPIERSGLMCGLPTSNILARYIVTQTIAAGNSSMYFALPNINGLYNSISNIIVSPAFANRTVAGDSGAGAARGMYGMSRPTAFGLRVRTLQAASQVQPTVIGSYMSDSLWNLNALASNGANVISSVISSGVSRELDPTVQNQVVGLPTGSAAFEFSDAYLQDTPSVVGTQTNALGYDNFGHSFPVIIVSNNDAAAITVRIEVVLALEATSTSIDANFQTGDIAPYRNYEISEVLTGAARLLALVGRGVSAPAQLAIGGVDSLVRYLSPHAPTVTGSRTGNRYMLQ